MGRGAGGQGFQLRQLRRLTHGNEVVIALNGFRSFRVETRVAVRMADGEDHDAEFMMNALTADCRANQRRLRRNFDFFDQHLICTGTVAGDIKKVEKVRTEEALRNAMARRRVG